MQDKILKIAESLPYEFITDGDDRPLIIIEGKLPTPFNPYENDSDAFKVLEAGIKEFGYTRFLGAFEKFVRGDENLRKAICEAYLALIKQESESAKP